MTQANIAAEGWPEVAANIAAEGWPEVAAEGWSPARPAPSGTT